MIKGCIDCAHQRLGKLGVEPKRCEKGLTDEHTRWWDENGHKTRIEIVTVMPCFEETELSKLGSKLLNSLEELKSAVEKVL